MLLTGSDRIDAELAFSRAVRARRRASAVSLLRGRRPSCALALPVRGEEGTRPQALTGIREISLESITSTLEPSRARMFDRAFRPAASAKARWERIWMAEQRGAPLPPIAVAPVEGGYAIRDGHHRVSVARARGALTIEATLA